MAFPIIVSYRMIFQKYIATLNTPTIVLSSLTLFIDFSIDFSFTKHSINIRSVDPFLSEIYFRTKCDKFCFLRFTQRNIPEENDFQSAILHAHSLQGENIIHKTSDILDINNILFWIGFFKRFVRKVLIIKIVFQKCLVCCFPIE